jgi:hypothetical protein
MISGADSRRLPAPPLSRPGSRFAMKDVEQHRRREEEKQEDHLGR